MPKRRFSIPVRGNFIDHRFIPVTETPRGPDGEWVSRSPADFSDELGRFQYSYSAIDMAVSAARRAFTEWRKTPAEKRLGALRTFREIFSRRGEELVEYLAREVGKPVWEAQSVVRQAIEQLDVQLGDSLRFVIDYRVPVESDGALGSCRHRPRGVLAVVGPSTSPLILPLGQIIPALLLGNTVVFKPSEKAALLGQIIAEVFRESEIPAGVFNLIQGEQEVGRRLCVHEGVDGIFFGGSQESGARIKQDTLQQHWKILGLEMGGKNPMIVWGDADPDLALRDALLGAFMSAGQRCTSTSRILVERRILDSFVTRFHERAKAFSIGHPLENPFMGPLIEQGAVDRYMKFVGIAAREGCEVVMRGKLLDLSTQGNFVTPSICVAADLSVDAARKSVFQQTEVCAPCVAIIGVNDLEQAIAQANVTQYGLVASVYTKDRAIYEKCWDGLQMGLVNWNRPTFDVSPRLPFGGLKKSGNHFPMGVLTATHCVYPVASLEAEAAQALSTDIPGLNWA